MSDQTTFVGVTVRPAVSPNEPSAVHRAIGKAMRDAMSSGVVQTVPGRDYLTEYTVTPITGSARRQPAFAINSPTNGATL